ncbi:hypothetical protein F5877DRAFT_75965 [Lentinula edodes]|nr:hypothetical protein F5877DRAFT_75965 [Lentinula edodes]
MSNYILLLRYYPQRLRMPASTSTSRDLPSGLTLYQELSRLELTTSTIYHDPLLATFSPFNVSGTPQDLLGTSSKSSVAVPIAPFELQLAPSTLHHKSLIPKPTLRPILTVMKSRDAPFDEPSALRDLDLSNVEATSHVELRIASPLPPPTLKDVHPQAQSPGTYPHGRIPSQELTPSRPISIHDLLDPILTF